jgi:hypothetical protein
MTETNGVIRRSSGNPALRALLEEAGLSNAALARAVVAAGAKEGIHIGTNPTSVKRMLGGGQSRWPVPRLVAAVLSGRLRREIGVTECGFADRSPVPDDRYDGLRCAATLDDTVRTVAELSGRDVKRRNLLMGSAFTAGAFAEPALFALTTPPTENTARNTGRRVGIPDVEIITETLDHLRRLDHRYGAGRIREQVVQLLNREANTTLHGSYSEKTGKALFSAVAQASWLAGWTSEDVGRPALAQRYYIQALNLAMGAGDRQFAAHMLWVMSRLTLNIGRGVLTEHDRLRHTRQAIALARAGHSAADGKTTPTLSAMLHAIEACGQALLGDANTARTAMRNAEHCRDRADAGGAPTFLSTHWEASLAADLGRCLRDLGEPAPAARLITQAIDGSELWKVRSRCFFQTDLAATHLIGRDYEHATAVARDAVRTAAQLSSTVALDRLRTLQRQLHPLRKDSPHLNELDQQITDLLTRKDVDGPAGRSRAG